VRKAFGDTHGLNPALILKGTSGNEKTVRCKKLKLVSVQKKLTINASANTFIGLKLNIGFLASTTCQENSGEDEKLGRERVGVAAVGAGLDPTTHLLLALFGSSHSTSALCCHAAACASNQLHFIGSVWWNAFKLVARRFRCLNPEGTFLHFLDMAEP
jgi:hypothetical protein